MLNPEGSDRTLSVDMQAQLFRNSWRCSKSINTVSQESRTSLLPTTTRKPSRIELLARST